METLTKTTSETINDLIEINNDRIEGYDTASKETKETDLKALFNEMVSTSRKFKEELAGLLNRFNGHNPPTVSTTTSGKLYRVWMDIKSALTGKDRKAILASCEYGEDAALETYDKVLKENGLPSEIRSVVEKQRGELQRYHDRIKTLRDITK